jgi:hypothetical protein
MTQEREPSLNPRLQQAVDELTQTIRQRYPDASFRLARGIDEPDQVHLWTTVDLDDPDEVLDLVLDRLLELEIDEGIPLYVIPIRTPERVLEEMRTNPRPARRLHRTVSSLSQQLRTETP